MRPLALAVLLAAPASALSRGTESFLKELGIDSRAPEVIELSSDSVKAKTGEVYTLDSVAAKRDETELRSFLVTRSFLHAFREDPGVQFPDNELYSAVKYMTAEERRYIAKTLMAGPPKRKSRAK